MRHPELRFLEGESDQKLAWEKPRQGRKGTSAAGAVAAPDADGLFARSLKLGADDEMVVTWRERPARPLPPAPPFTLEDGLRRLGEVGTGAWVPSFRWKNAAIPEFPSREEAQFWVLAVKALHPQGASPQSVAKALAGVRLDGRMSADRLKALTHNRVMDDHGGHRRLQPSLLHCAAALLEPEEFVYTPPEERSWLFDQAAEQFHARIFPYLSEFQRDALRRRIGALREATVPPTGQPCAPPHYRIAAVLGCHDLLRRFLRQLPDGVYAGSALSPWLIFGLEDAASVEAEWRRLGAALQDAAQARAWIALTGYDALDVIADSAARFHKERDAAAKVARALLLVAAPEAALPALRLAVETDVQTVGQKWLAEHPGHAAVGLTPVATGEGKLARAARKYLQTMHGAGLDAVLRQAAQRLPSEQGAWLRKHVLGGATQTTLPLMVAVPLPESLRAAFARVKAAKPKPWLSVGALPPVRVAGGVLAHSEVELLLAELRRLAPGEASDLLALLQEHADARSLDGFTAKVFDLWTEAGQPTAEKWVLGNLGRLGGDGLIAKVAAQIRGWPDENKLTRARFGVACLAAVASDAALNVLKDFSFKHRWSAIRHDCEQAMQAIAAQRGMTPQELADGIVTDAGLDAKGTRTFDFGPRQFTLTLGPDLQPTLRDAEGCVRPDLPAPLKTDDASKATRATEDWTLLKKTLRDTLRVQVRRLEDRMVHGQRWTPESFRRLIVGHPLLCRLARRLVLGAYDGRLRASFRVTEDRTFADAHDAAYPLPDAGQIGVAHPVELDAATRAAWRATLDDYGIVPPFSQTARPVYGADPGELEMDAITRFAGRPVPARHLFGTLEGNRWERGEDDGVLVTHEKHFEAADQTAVIRYTGLPVFGLKDAPPQEVESVQFLRGKPGYRWHREPDLLLKIVAVDPLVLSEALRVAHAIVGQAD